MKIKIVKRKQKMQIIDMKRVLGPALMVLMPISAFAAPAVYQCNDGADGNIPQSAGWVNNITIGTANAVTTTAVPATANRVIAAGWGNFAMCERSGRCSTFSGVNPSGNGYLLNPNGRYLPTQGGVISLTSPVTGTVIQLEFCHEN